MALVRAVDGTYISHPFIEDGDAITRGYNMVCTQRETDYNAGQISLDDPMSNAASAGVIELPFPADSNAYFVGDSGHVPIGGGMIQFTRTFSNIPKTITVPSGSAFVTFPGLANGHLAITGLTMDEANETLNIETGNAHGLDLGNDIYIQNLVWSQDNGVDPATEKSYTTDYGWTKVTPTAIISSTVFQVPREWDDTYTLTVLDGEAWNKEQNEYQISTIEMSSGGVSPIGVKIDTTATNTINVGDSINVFVNFKVGTSGTFVHSVASRYKVLAKVGNKIIVDVGLYWSAQDSLIIQGIGRIANTGSARAPQSFNVATSTTYEYVLPGTELTVPSAEDINVPQTFRVIDQNTGDVATTAQNGGIRVITTGNLEFFTVSLPTIPTSSEYQSMIGSKANIVIESSVSEWAGNILLIKTKTCRAQ